MTKPETPIDLAEWCRERRITEVECMIPDVSGVPRGKILPTEKFLDGVERDSHRLPESIFVQTVTGDFPEDDSIVALIDRDIVLRVDPTTIRMVPWYAEPTAQVICDCIYPDGRPVDIYSREILRRILRLYDEKGLAPVISPEIEFYLVRVNDDPDYPLVPPIGRSGRPETARQCYGIDAVNEFDALFEDIYDHADAQDLFIDTLNHEHGAAQIEINFRHGEPLLLADQVFLFKRTVRQTALNHGVYATFMAKPMETEPGSSMHIHQSVVDRESGRNVFSNDDGGESLVFHHFIAGLQAYLPRLMPLFAPNVNSYRRFTFREAPINIHWGHDNRSCGLRVPDAWPENRRIENRLAGADVNSYLAIAGTLLAGYLGMAEQLTPTPAAAGSVFGLERGVPEHFASGLSAFEDSGPAAEILGQRFVRALLANKAVEYANYHKVISSWEREHLLLNV